MNAVERAVAKVGGPTKASFICRVSVAALYKWRQAGGIPDTHAALRLAAASGVKVEDLAGKDRAA